MAGATLTKVEQRRPNLRFPFPDNFVARLKGAKVLTLSRRAKYLMAHLSSGEVLVMHLGMSGRFTIEPAPNSDISHSAPGGYAHAAGGNPKHDHVVFHLAGGCKVTYNDARRFGYMLLIDETELEAHKLFRNLGVEPLGNRLNAAYLAALASGRKSDLKAFLMDQHVIAGLGNIYVCEALHRARLSPTRRAGTLAGRNGKPSDRTESLVGAVRSVLRDAIAAGGSSLRDYRKADGALGYFQHTFRVYGRAGEACKHARCGGTIKRKVQSGRSTFYCPRCQR